MYVVEAEPPPFAADRFHGAADRLERCASSLQRLAERGGGFSSEVVARVGTDLRVRAEAALAELRREAQSLASRRTAVSRSLDSAKGRVSAVNFQRELDLLRRMVGELSDDDWRAKSEVLDEEEMVLRATRATLEDRLADVGSCWSRWQELEGRLAELP